MSEKLSNSVGTALVNVSPQAATIAERGQDPPVSLASARLALQYLDQKLEDVTDLLAMLRDVRPVSEQQLLDAIKEAQRCARLVRLHMEQTADCIQVAHVEWATRAELEARISELGLQINELVLKPRSRLELLAMELERGTIQGCGSFVEERLRKQQAAAVGELRNAAKKRRPPEIPGNAQNFGDWLQQLGALTEPKQSSALDALQRDFPALLDFVVGMWPKSWAFGASTNTRAPDTQKPPSPNAARAFGDESNKVKGKDNAPELRPVTLLPHGISVDSAISAPQTEKSSREGATKPSELPPDVAKTPLPPIPPPPSIAPPREATHARTPFEIDAHAHNVVYNTISNLAHRPSPPQIPEPQAAVGSTTPPLPETPQSSASSNLLSQPATLVAQDSDHGATTGETSATTLKTIPAPPPPSEKRPAEKSVHTNTIGRDAMPSSVVERSVARGPAVKVNEAPSTITAQAPKIDDTIANESTRIPAAAETTNTFSLPHRPLLSEELLTFENFSKKYWIGPSGTGERAPWTQRDFGEQLCARMHDEFEYAGQTGRFHRMFLFARAAEKLDAKPILPSRDIGALVRLWDKPTSPIAGRDDKRAQTLWASISMSIQEEPLRLRFLAFLEGMQPTRTNRISEVGVDDLIVLCDFQDRALETTVASLLRIAAKGEEPLLRVQQALRADPQDTPADIEQLLIQKRQELHSEALHIFMLYHKSLRTSHCRDAFRLFVDQITGTLRKLYPLDKGGDETWDWESLQTEIDRILPIHERIAEKNDARKEDRKWMTKNATRIAELAQQTNDLLYRLHRAQTSEGLAVGIPLGEIEALTSGGPLARPDEELLRKCLARLLHPPSPMESTGASSLVLTDLYAHPDLVGVLENVNGAGLEPGAQAWSAPLDNITDPVYAAALMLQVPLMAPNTITADDKPLERLRSLLEPHKRIHVLARTMSGLPSNEQSILSRALEAALSRVHNAIDQLARLAKSLDALAVPLAVDLRYVCQIAQMNTSPEKIRHSDPSLMVQWLRSVKEVATMAIDDATAKVKSRADHLSPDRRASIHQAIEQSRYSDALLLVGEPIDEIRAPIRETLWRKQAAKTFQFPTKSLQSMPEERALTRFIKSWNRGLSSNANSDRGMRRAFAEQFFPQTLKNGDSLLSVDSESPPNRFFAHCTAIRRWLSESQVNPCFLPQLSRFERIEILTPLKTPDDAGFVQAVADVAGSHHGALAVVLAPHMQENVRKLALKELRRRRATAAVLDDLDLCRLLLSPGQRPNLIIGLLEIIFEQQRLAAISPFSGHDGQHVKIEMFVGRKDQTRSVAHTSDYSRLFSGRKLGKSALLKFIEATEDGCKLPSGYTLRVVYVSAVGAHSEQDLVDRIVRGMEQRLNLDFEQERSAHRNAPAVMLIKVKNRFILENPRTSLLIVLDEADSFVEEQIKIYPERRENSLSFQMRSYIESDSDPQGLPRIRFILSGYRATNTNQAAWANWHRYLQLTPLSNEEAASLVEGPLARLGIDASLQAAAIAYRCGYQPAVLLHFGQTLLQRIEARSSDPDGLEVTDDDVLWIFDQPSMQEEIRTIVFNNFMGNPAPGITFAALLLELAENNPLDGIDNATERLIRRFTEMGIALSWLATDEKSRANNLESLLDELVERQLLVRHAENGDRVFFLKFPHHLIVLLRTNLEKYIHEEVSRLERHKDASNLYEGIQALVSPNSTKNLEEAMSAPRPGTLPVKASIVGAMWPEALNSRSGGVPNRLSIDPDSCIQASCANLLQRLDRQRLAVLNAVPHDVQRVLEQRNSSNPKLYPPLFTGGADLLRWALSQAKESPEIYEIHGVGRLSREHVGWWFERVRGFEFISSNAIDRILERTSGIPLLVGFVDQKLQSLHNDQVGLDVSARDVELALSDQVLWGSAQLLEGPSWMRLEPREFEILRMVATASRTTQEDANLEEELTTSWHILRPSCDVPPITERDELAILVLRHLGLVRESSGSMRAGGLVAIPTTDALYGVLRAHGFDIKNVG